MTELKACPFDCHGKPVMSHDSVGGVFIKCPVCFCRGPRASSQVTAEEMWNARNPIKEDGK